MVDLDELARFGKRARDRKREKKRKREDRRRAAQQAAQPRQRTYGRADHHGPSHRLGLGRPTRGLVTVLMTAFQSQQWISAAVNSILMQKLPWGWRLELLVGVDSCPDTLPVAEAIGDPRVVVIEMSKNVGTYETLNTLLDHARGSLVAVMDSDDISKPRRLSSEICALVSDPKLSIVAGRYQNCDAALKPTGKPIREVAHGAMMVRRTLYDRLGGYKRWRCGADWDFLTRARKTGARVTVLDETVLLRRVHPSSLCSAPATRPSSPARNRAFREIEKEKARASPTVPRRLARAHRVVRDERLVFEDGKVGVVIPTIPRREDTAQAVIGLLLKQGVSVIHLHLNGHRVVPDWAKNPRIKTFLHSAGTGPLVRFRHLPDTQFILSVDDDIRYPRNYVKETVAHLKKLGPGTAVSYHASTWPSGLPSGYASRRTVAYGDVASRYTGASYIGCGVAAFHACDLWHLDADGAPPGFEMEDDVWISSACARTGVKLVRPPSSANWIQSTPEGQTGLYAKATSDGFKRRDAAMRGAARLGVWNPSPGTTSRTKPSWMTPSRAPTGSDEQKFWASRYQETGSSILSVGRRDASVGVNKREYATAVQQFQDIVQSDFPDPSAISVLDVGYGLGHYARALAKLGVKDYVGIDFATPSVPRDLAAMGYTFLRRVDASDKSLDLGRRFDLVIMIDVVFHIVDDRKFAQATKNLKKHASGLIYITGLFEDVELAAHVKHRAPRHFRMGKPLSVDPWRDNKIARFRVGG